MKGRPLSSIRKIIPYVPSKPFLTPASHGDFIIRKSKPTEKLNESYSEHPITTTKVLSLTFHHWELEICRYWLVHTKQINKFIPYSAGNCIR